MGRGRIRARLALIITFSALVATPFITATAGAATITANGNVNITAVVLPTTPTEAAFIDQPQDNEHFQTTPLVVIGRCGAGLLVRIFDNGQLAGSVVCAADSTFTANIILTTGKNVLTSLNYDAFEQAGPVSPAVTVYVDKQPDVTPEEKAAQEIALAIGSPTSDTTAVSSDEAAPFDPTKTSERIFEGTVIEPLAKIFDIKATVASSTNSQVNIAITATFTLSFVLLLTLLML